MAKVITRRVKHWGKKEFALSLIGFLVAPLIFVAAGRLNQASADSVLIPSSPEHLPERCDYFGPGDSDGDGVIDCYDACIHDATKHLSSGVCGCGTPDVDSDGDGIMDCQDGCADNADKTQPGVCGCGTPDTDTDDDGKLDCEEQCINDKDKTQPGVCGCGTPDLDTDKDGKLDCEEECDTDPNKTVPGVCGCGILDIDTDNDGKLDCEEQCINDKDKTQPGVCGCGTPDTDTDGDGKLDCEEQCINDKDKTEPGVCGCGTPDTDTDGDGKLDCEEHCINDKDKTEPGVCGCGTPDTDTDGDGKLDCEEQCIDDKDKTEPGVCGCGTPDVDTDKDGKLDCEEECDTDPNKTVPGVCGCDVPDTDRDDDGVMDCSDLCPDNPNLSAPGKCNCDDCPLDPCDKYSISNINITQTHDGVTTTFKGKNATKIDGTDAWYQDFFPTTAYKTITYVCMKNPDTVGLQPEQIYLTNQYIFWLDRDISKTATRINIALKKLPELGGTLEKQEECFICGYVRNTGCFHPDITLTMADKTEKKAREIAVGDLLWNPVLKSGVRVQRVIEGPEPIGLIELAYKGFLLHISQKHAILTPEGLKLANTLKPGDEIIDGENHPQKLERVKILPIEEGQRVINFVLETDTSNPEARMLLAEGIVSGDLVIQNSIDPDLNSKFDKE